jgi:shikimate kinase
MALNRRSNVVLIGMPGAGKSTVGVILAKQASKGFVDTDVLIQTAEKRSLQQIVDTGSYLALRDIEERVLLSLTLKDHVVATGGSAVYSESAMGHLKRIGVVVFLDVSLAVLQSRLGDFQSRGIARRSDQTLSDLYQERTVLYAKYADITVDCESLSQEQVSQRILHELRRQDTEGR